jgi:spore germination cell wall hydrolase CwlJ-like protein
MHPPALLQPRASAEDLTCLALNIYWESGDEPIVGQQLVAYVTMQRTRYEGFGGSNLCDVVYKPIGGFSWTHGSKRWQAPKDLERFRVAQEIALQALHNTGPPLQGYGAALFFINLQTASLDGRNWFLSHLVCIGTVGNHSFFRYPKLGEAPQDCAGKKQYSQN